MAKTAVDSEADPESWVAELESQIAHAAHLLPSQGPIEVFVHHNTLHIYESVDFHEGVYAGWKRFGGNPYLTESEYRKHLSSGRILLDHLSQIVDEDLATADSQRLEGHWLESLGPRKDLRMAMLQHPLHVGSDAELRWIIAESDALERFPASTGARQRKRLLEGAEACLKSAMPIAVETRDDWRDSPGGSYAAEAAWSESTWTSYALHLLFRVCRQGVDRVGMPESKNRSLRPRDLILKTVGEDIDRYVQDVLIRFCGAFVDQGYSDWLLPNRDQGFYDCFLELYSGPGYALPAWMSHLSREIQELKQCRVTALDSIRQSLEDLEIPAEDQEEFISQSLLALRGWAGIVWQLESGVSWVVHQIPAGSLAGLLAVQLLLEKQAIRYFGNPDQPFEWSVAQTLKSLRNRSSKVDPMAPDRRAFLMFQVAQMRGWAADQLADLSDEQWVTLLQEVEGFNSIQRRRTYHLAFERRYRNAALDAFGCHASRVREGQIPLPKGRSSFQILTCIDDREESFRRHLEEVDPQCETFGAAGFFAVAMYYRGAADGFYKPLCPGVIIPDHYVQEDVGYTFEGVHKNRAQLRRRWGWARHLFHTHSRNFLGGIVAGIAGSLATAPLVARVLFPRLTSQIQSRFGSMLQPPPVTRLQLERSAKVPGPDNGHVGYTLDEMAGVVVRLLEDIGLTQTERFARLMLICGHGSSSLNNPHESAYCCGACAGKRGGPNARAFAAMANDYRVRVKVKELGITIPDDTTFVGAYHNTCDDSVVFYDLDGMPSSHRHDFEHARTAIEEARRRNAHERSRRFVSCPLTATPDEALRHVEARAQDISQARPEYNHATNALTVVGRRDWTRGLFLDRRSFLTSYDSRQDDADSSILFRILSAAIPVCAGINLEYYFSCVDPTVYGSGSKLPHNVVSMLGVMEGTSSDLRTGLYRQMVEIHEPLRLLFVIETTPEAMLSIMDRNPVIGSLCRGGWVQLAVIDPETSHIQRFDQEKFVPYQPSDSPPEFRPTSLACYAESRDHLPFFSISENRKETGEC